jgi:hypothetical protein
MNRPSPVPGFPGEPELCPRPKLLEDQTLLIGRNTGPVVGDLDPQVRIQPGGGDPDLLARWGVFDRVVEQVSQHLLKPVAVAPHGRHLAAHVGAHPDFVLGQRDSSNRIADELSQVDVVEAVCEGAGLNPRRVEHVPDQGGQPLCLAADQAEE